MSRALVEAVSFLLRSKLRLHHMRSEGPVVQGTPVTLWLPVRNRTASIVHEIRKSGSTRNACDPLAPCKEQNINYCRNELTFDFIVKQFIGNARCSLFGSMNLGCE